MRINTILAFALFALLVIAAAVVACSDGSQTGNCSAGTLALQVELDGTANFADTIQVSSADPAATLTESTPHTPDGATVQTVTVTFPNGYPSNKAITFLVRAYANSQLLGENTATVHLDDPCGTGGVAIRSSLLDAAPTTD